MDEVRRVDVFGGPKGSVKIPGTPFGGSITDGIYIRFGSSGSVDDVGMRVKAEGSVSADPIQIKGGDTMDFSFARCPGEVDSGEQQRRLVGRRRGRRGR